MSPTIKIWLRELYKEEMRITQIAIKQNKRNIKNYDGLGPNPTEQTIKDLTEYLTILKDLLSNL
jgi:hypothetical protein